MMVGRQYYSDTDMLRMQREAEARVRDMQERARRTVEENSLPPPPPATRSRNWSSNPNMQRQRRGGLNQPGEGHGESGGEPPSAPPAAEPPPPPVEAAPVREIPPATGEEKGTILGDIMEALGLDSDYLLIIGLILILINQRADTTLILALAYLLI